MPHNLQWEGRGEVRKMSPNSKKIHICIKSFSIVKKMLERSGYIEPQTDFIGFKSFIQIFCGNKRSSDSISTFSYLFQKFLCVSNSNFLIRVFPCC